MAEPLQDMLTGGHPNSLGRTIEVVELVLADPSRFDELFSCYESEDEVVRLRTSNAMKRIAAVRRDLLVPYIDRFIAEIGELDQASAQWTLAQLFSRLAGDMSDHQKNASLSVMKRNLEEHQDWIVLNATIETVSEWAKQDAALANWIRPHLERLSNDSRQSVAKRASRKLKALGAD